MTPERIKALAKQAGFDTYSHHDAYQPVTGTWLANTTELIEFVRLVREPLETHNTMLKAALRGVIKVANRKTDEFGAAKDALGAKP